MEAGLDHVSQLFVATFEGLPNSGPPAVEDGVNPDEPAIDDREHRKVSDMDALDELAVDESKAYKNKITKYIRNSLACVKESMFFYHDAGRKPLQRTPVASLQISLSKTDQHVNACG